MRTGADEPLSGRIEIECQHCDALFRRARRCSLHLFAPLIQAFSRQLVTGLTVRDRSLVESELNGTGCSG